MAQKKNRRRERRHVLDVKLSSNQVRRRRVQWAVSSLVAVALLTLTGYGLWRGGWWTLQEFVYQNEQLRIREFQVRTDGVIDPEILRRWAGVTTNDNLFAIDLHPIKRQLEMHGMIRQAALERVLPGTLRLRVTERVPLARIRRLVSGADGRVKPLDFGLDETGHVMPLEQRIVRPETVRLWGKLPELAGVDPREIVPGVTITNQAARAALRFLATFHSTPMNGMVGISRLDPTEPEVLEVTTVQGHTVKFLDTGFERQLARWELVHRTCESNRVSYAWLDMSPTNHVPIRLVPLALVNSANPILPNR